MATKLYKMETYLNGLLAINGFIIWSYNIIHKIKPLHLYYDSAYVHHTWQDGNLLWRAPTHKITWSLDHVVLQGHVTN